MEINFKDYLTESEVKEIIAEELKYLIREQLEDKNLIDGYKISITKLEGEK